MSRRLLFISKGEDSASTRYRARQFFGQLAEQGFVPSHVTAAGGAGAYLAALRQARQADIVVVLRKTFPWPLLMLLRRLAPRLVFDFDDAIFCNTDGSPSSTRMRRFSSMVSACDHVLAGNPFLVEQAARFNPAVTLLPTCLDVGRYQATYDKPVDTFDLVWIGSRSTRKYLVEILPALRLAAQHVPRLRLKIVADFDLPEAGLPTLAIPWSEAGEAEALGSAHVGIAPMRDDDWSRGKCALKVLQYMAAGLPVISSAAGVNAGIVRAGENGFLAESPEDWVEHLSALAGNAELRAQLGSVGRDTAIESYSITTVGRRLASVLASLA